MEYEKTIHGLQRKRRELIQQVECMKAEIAKLHNQRITVEKALEAFGCHDYKDGPRMHRVTFPRKQLRRFIIDYLRDNGTGATGMITDALMQSRGEDPHDRLYRGQIQRAVSQALYLMGEAGTAERLEMRKGRQGYIWGLTRQPHAASSQPNSAIPEP